ncbi:hypothetical protein MMC18_006827 [Xylographa bjoerkii]|nr:hypothetical protein [Xylographa bjoerkii]
MSTPTTYLITGANRGIGRGLLEVYLSRPNSTVVAGVRDPSNDTSKSLNSVAVGKGSKLIIVKLDSLSETDAKSAVQLLKSEHGIDHLDVVIANSGIANYYGSALETPISELRDHINVNTIGSLVLFQATWSLLQVSQSPKFILVSTGIASLGMMEHIPMPTTAYGSSKAAANYIVLKIHYENPQLTIFPLHPGWVQTDMGNAGALANGLAEAPVILKDCIEGMTTQSDWERPSGKVWEEVQDTRLHKARLKQKSQAAAVETVEPGCPVAERDSL